MKTSKAIATLTAIRSRFGDLNIVGGTLMDETPPRNICVINKEGMEIWPTDPNGVGESDVEGVFIT